MTTAVDINIHYHKCAHCQGYYFMPCGCAVGNTWCNDCKEDQAILKENKFYPEVNLADDQHILVKSRGTYEY